VRSIEAGDLDELLVLAWIAKGRAVDALPESP
jgi:hypothetical protein